MQTYDLFGLTDGRLDNVRPIVERALAIEFEPHESTFLGDYYLATITTDENIQLRNNLDPVDGDPAELEFAQVSILIYVNGTDRADEIARALKSQLPSIIHLRRRVI